MEFPEVEEIALELWLELRKEQAVADYWREAAAMILGKKPEEITKEERQAVKELEFAKMYGGQQAMVSAHDAPLKVGAVDQAVVLGRQDKPVPKRTYTPIGCLVALHLYEVRETPGGLLMPDGTKQDAFQTPVSLVIACGPDCKWVKPGMRVLAANNAVAQIVIHKGQKTVLLREDHLSGIEDPDKDEQDMDAGDR